MAGSRSALLVGAFRFPAVVLLSQNTHATETMETLRSSSRRETGLNLALACLLAGCSETAPAIPLADFTPVGDGLKFVGVSMVVTALVIVIGGLIKVSR
jgi:hypothetical protein